MVSEFIDEHNDFLALKTENYEPNVQCYTCEFLKIGESREGYWSHDRFVMERPTEIVEIKYPKAEGRQHVWVFDDSSRHAAIANDTLVAANNTTDCRHRNSIFPN